jgi:hypothetical protein
LENRRYGEAVAWTGMMLGEQFMFAWTLGESQAALRAGAIGTSVIRTNTVIAQESTSIIGKTFEGAGTVIGNNPLTKITGIFKANKKDPYHFVNRVIERGLNPSQIVNTFKKPYVILSQWKGERFLYISKDMAIVINKNGEIITGWLKNEFGPVLIQILKEAGY